MKWYFYTILIIMLINIQSSIKALAAQIDNKNSSSNKKENKKSFILENYLGKNVCLEVDNEDINNIYLFSSTLETTGEIVEYDNNWLLFKYYSKQKKKYIKQYFRRKDITSINEINTESKENSIKKNKE